MAARSPSGVVFFVLAALLSAAAPAHAAEFLGTRWGYKLDVPEDWKRIPDEQLQSMLADARRAGAAPSVMFDAGFQPASSKSPSDYPLVIVQVVRYSSMGLNNSVEQDQFEHVMRVMIGRTGMPGMAVHPALLTGSPKPTGIEVGGAVNPAERRYLCTTTEDVPGRGGVSATVCGYFGPDAVVQVSAFNSVKASAHGREIALSLGSNAPKPAPVPYVAPPVRSTGSGDGPTPMGKYVLENARNRAVDGAILGGIIGAISAFKAYRGGRRNHNDGDDAPPPSSSNRPF